MIIKRKAKAYVPGPYFEVPVDVSQTKRNRELDRRTQRATTSSVYIGALLLVSVLANVLQGTLPIETQEYAQELQSAEVLEITPLTEEQVTATTEGAPPAYSEEFSLKQEQLETDSVRFTFDLFDAAEKRVKQRAAEQAAADAQFLESGGVVIRAQPGAISTN